jgi:hypothetical protein
MPWYGHSGTFCLEKLGVQDFQLQNGTDTVWHINDEYAI